MTQKVAENVVIHCSEEPLIATIGVKSDHMLNEFELSLKNWFKCTQFGDNCFHTNDNRKAFVRHCETRHQNRKHFCIYCPNHTVSTLYTAEELLIHLSARHKYRNFQCNLCLYRAISADHVNIHQSIVHNDIYRQTRHKKQLNGKSCKIIQCYPISEDEVPQPYEHWARHVATRVVDTIKEKHFQCYYCQFTDESKQKVVQHLVQTHPDNHILYYKPEPMVTSTETTRAQRTRNNTENDMRPNRDTQVNRISSTESDAEVRDWSKNPKIENYVKELAFGPKKKNRKSQVQTSQQKGSSGLSNKGLNNQGFYYSGRGASGASMFANRPKGPMRWGPNQKNMISRPKDRESIMSTSKRRELLKLKVEMENRLDKRAEPEDPFDSDDSIEEMPKRPKLDENRTRRSSMDMSSIKRPKMETFAAKPSKNVSKALSTHRELSPKPSTSGHDWDCHSDPSLHTRDAKHSKHKLLKKVKNLLKTDEYDCSKRYCQVSMTRLPELNYDNRDMIQEFYHRFERRSRLNGTNESRDTKPIELLTVSSSSDDELEISIFNRVPKKTNLITDDDDDPILSEVNSVPTPDEHKSAVSPPIQTSPVPSGKRYECCTCNAISDNRIEMKEHILRAHPNQSIRFKTIYI